MGRQNEELVDEKMGKVNDRQMHKRVGESVNGC